MRLVQDGIVYYLGRWRGRCVNVDDENKEGRIRGLIPGVLEDVVSNWALPSFPAAVFGTPNIGDQVWFEFEQGNPEKPIYVGYAPSAKDGAQAAAPTMIAEDDETTSLIIGKGGGAVEVSEFADDGDGNLGPQKLVEPATTSQPGYPNVKSMRVANNFIEVDGTPGQARIQMYHGSGAYLEFGATGQLNLVAKGARREWTKGQKVEVVTAKSVLYVGGDEHREVKGSAKWIYNSAFEQRIRRDFDLLVQGNQTYEVSGRRTVTIGGVDKRIASFVDDTSLGDRNMGTMGNKEEIITGAYGLTIANVNADPVGAYKLTLVAGDYVRTIALGGATDVVTGAYTGTFGAAWAVTTGGLAAITAGAALNLTAVGALGITSTVGIAITAGAPCLITAPQIALGGLAAVHPLIYGEILVTQILATLLPIIGSHVHVGNLGAPTSPSVELGTAISTAVTALPTSLSPLVTTQ